MVEHAPQPSPTQTTILDKTQKDTTSYPTIQITPSAPETSEPIYESIQSQTPVPPRPYERVAINHPPKLPPRFHNSHHVIQALEKNSLLNKQEKMILIDFLNTLSDTTLHHSPLKKKMSFAIKKLLNSRQSLHPTQLIKIFLNGYPSIRQIFDESDQKQIFFQVIIATCDTYYIQELIKLIQNDKSNHPFYLKVFESFRQLQKNYSKKGVSSHTLVNMLKRTQHELANAFPQEPTVHEDIQNIITYLNRLFNSRQIATLI